MEAEGEWSWLNALQIEATLGLAGFLEKQTPRKYL